IPIQPKFSIAPEHANRSPIQYCRGFYIGRERSAKWQKQHQGRSPVRSSTIIMIAVAAVFGLVAVFLAQSWLNSQAEARMKSLEAQKTKPALAQTIVVAARQLRFGNELSPSVLREMPWPADAVPQGAFRTIQQVLAEGKRVVLTA